MDVKEEQLLGGAVGEHWYYRSKQLALDSLLRGIPFTRVLDIGAGSAIFSKHLLESGAVSAVCVDPNPQPGLPEHDLVARAYAQTSRTARHHHGHTVSNDRCSMRASVVVHPVRA